MPLEYLLFDFSDEEDGDGSFDAMASVLPDRWGALAAEVADVLGWAHGAFGAPAASRDEGEWDFDLDATSEAGPRLDARYDAARGEVRLARPPAGRLTLTLTISGSRAFCDAFGEAFPAGD